MSGYFAEQARAANAAREALESKVRDYLVALDADDGDGLTVLLIELADMVGYEPPADPAAAPVKPPAEREPQDGYSDMKMSEVRADAKARGISTWKLTKAKIVAILRAADEREAKAVADDSPDSDDNADDEP